MLQHYGFWVDACFLGDAKVNKQILLAAWAADSAMGAGSVNGSGGGKENDPLSDSLFITALAADEEHGDGEVQQRQSFPEMY